LLATTLKGKIKMLEVEIQKLTAAIETLTKVVQSMALPTITANAVETPTETPTITDKPRQKKPKAEPVPAQEAAPEVFEPSSSISFKQYTQNDVRELAMQIVRDDSTARPRIMEILEQHGSKTANQLKLEDCHEVHDKLLALAFKIAKEGEPV
jgi:hypothetical protein